MRRLQKKIVLKGILKQPDTVSVLNVIRKRIEEFSSVIALGKLSDFSSASEYIEFTKGIRKQSLRENFPI